MIPMHARAFPRRVSIVALCAAGLLGCAGERKRPEGEEPVGPEMTAVGEVLPFSEARELLRACDGTTVQSDSLWAPSDSELRVVEASLDDYLKGELPNDSSGDPLGRYSRQYLGLYRGGEKLVFVRGVSQLHLRRAVTFDTAHVPQSVKIASTLRRFREHPVSACDGGRGFFRAEYSLPARRITRFAFQAYEGH
jgi:hypothetical protein